MKLFGNKRNAARVERRHGAGAAGGGWRSLSGLQRGLILLAGSFLLLSVTVFALYKSFVKPVEIDREEELPVASELDGQEEENFQPPTVLEIETKVDEETGEEIQVEVEVPASHKEDFYNILVVGTDDDGSRTDTIMIARMDVKEHTVAVLSIPRDTLITGDYTVPKINGVYGAAGKGEAGMEALKSRLAKLLGFEVDGYALVNLDAFIELVDLVDGVEFNVPMDMDYDDPTQDLHIHFKAGLQHLDGQAAMEVVRYRKGYATQDIQRTKVQQEFLQVLAKKCLSVVNLTKIPEMAQIFIDNVTTDLTLGNIVYFGQELLKCDFEAMFTYTLEGEGVTIDGGSYYAVYLNKTLSVINEYFNPYETEITAANVEIRTPEAVRAEQAAEEAPEEVPVEEFPEEELPEEELPWEDGLPTDDWIAGPELPEEPDPMNPGDTGEEDLPPEEFWP